MSHQILSISVTEKCFSNIELMENICKFLNYQEQCQLLKVSPEFQYIIKKFVWKREYEEIEILSYETQDLIVSNKISEYKESNDVYLKDSEKIVKTKNILLSRNKLEIFLHLNKCNIKKLKILRIERLERNENVVQIKWPLKYNFENLISLYYYSITLTNKELREVAENCKNLKCLVLVKMMNYKGKGLVLLEDIDIEIIKSMKNLKKLIVSNNSTGGKTRYGIYTFKNIQILLNSLNLEKLILNVNIVGNLENAEDLNKPNLINLKSYKILELGTFKETEDFLYFQTHILIHLNNLYSLTLRRVTLKQKFFETLLQHCKNLIHLTLNLCIVNELKALPNLQHLNVYRCGGFECSKIKLIFSEMNLKSFWASNPYPLTNVLNFGYYNFSKNLQNFQFKDLTDCEFKKLLLYNKQNLNSLTEFHWSIHSDNRKFYDFKLSQICPYLKVLCCTYMYFELKDVLNLKFLHKLYIEFVQEIAISQFYSILKLENLKELSMGCYGELVEDCSSENLNVIKTNLLYLCIPWSKVMLYLTNFLLDLVYKNRNLSLICHHIENETILKLLENIKFQHHYKSINICGFLLDCQDIRNQDSSIMDLIKYAIKTFDRTAHLTSYFILNYQLNSL